MLDNLSHLTGAPLVDLIKREVCEHFGIPEIEMVSARRARAYAWPRQMAMGIAVELTPLSFPQIGRLFRRDHTTVMYALSQHRDRQASDAEWAADVAAIKARLKEMHGLAA